MTATIGIVAALPREARAMAGLRLRRKAWAYPFCRVMLKDDTALVVVQSGMGAENAFAAAKWLAEKGVSVLGCFGVSGGLDPELKAGDAVFADAVLKQAGDAVFPVWEKGGAHFDETFEVCVAAEGYTVRRGPIITVAAPVLNAEDKRALFDQNECLGRGYGECGRGSCRR
jgi:nucleoside phosphorylase